DLPRPAPQRGPARRRLDPHPDRGPSRPGPAPGRGGAGGAVVRGPAAGRRGSAPTLRERPGATRCDTTM
ncbi:MAG: hypothetical protein AVDCRST_MAG06-1162, partial [uncultured Nocardioides sp.]